MRLTSPLYRHKRLFFFLGGLIIYGTLIAYAIPPLSQYTPGETLDPACAPGATNCSVLIGGGTITTPVGSSAAIQFNTAGSFDGDADTFAWDNDNKRLFIGSGVSNTAFDNTAYGQLNILVASSGASSYTYDQQFYGVGSNDATFSGAYTGTIDPSYPYVIVLAGILSSGSPDQFVVQKVNCDGGDPFTATCDYGNIVQAGPFAITGSAQSLVDGVLITFAATTGHTANDTWYEVISGSASTIDPAINVVRDDETPLFVVDPGGNATIEGNTAIGGNASVGGNAVITGTDLSLGGIIVRTNSSDYSVSIGAGNAVSGTGSFIAGYGAGVYATNTDNAVLIGGGAGFGSNNAEGSVFIGNAAGHNTYSPNNTSDSVFIGNSAGSEAQNAIYSTFIGSQAGQGASRAANSIFIGQGAGINDPVNNTTSEASILIGSGTSTGGYSNSIALGANAANTMEDQFVVGSSYTNWQIAGVDYVWPNSQAAGSGYVLTNDGSGNLSWATVSGGGSPISIGTSGTTLYSSGLSGTGQGDTGSGNNIFLGNNTGNGATNAFQSNFLGPQAGMGATNAFSSNFFGFDSGYNATSASHANFLGDNAGYGATDASYSNLFGYQAGKSFTGNNIGSNNIIIGTNISLPDAAANALNLGGILFGTNTYSTTTGNPSITAVTSGKIGIATIPTQYTLEVGNSSVSGIVASFTNSTGSCTINPTTTSLSCSSDQNLKKNIESLDESADGSDSGRTVGDSILDHVLSLRPVTYNWNTEDDDDPKHTGFIAQEVKALFPDLVSKDRTTNLLSLNYMGLIPYTIQALQEMHLELQNINDVDTPNSWRDALVEWFGNTGNGITNFFAGKIKTDHIQTQELCIGDPGDQVCVTKEQLRALLDSKETAPVIIIPDTDTPSDDTVQEDEPGEVDSQADTTTNDSTETDEDTDAAGTQESTPSVQAPAEETGDTPPSEESPDAPLVPETGSSTESDAV